MWRRSGGRPGGSSHALTPQLFARWLSDLQFASSLRPQGCVHRRRQRNAQEDQPRASAIAPARCRPQLVSCTPRAARPFGRFRLKEGRGTHGQPAAWRACKLQRAEAASRRSKVLGHRHAPSRRRRRQLPRPPQLALPAPLWSPSTSIDCPFFCLDVGLTSDYCDDFVCTSSPAVESSVRQLAKDLQRANGRWTPIYASTVEYQVRIVMA